MDEAYDAYSEDSIEDSLTVLQKPGILFQTRGHNPC